MTIAATDTLKRTPLHWLHVEQKARMVPFAGYEMPVQYADGILKEHLHVRTAAGLFDVSHMGQFDVRPAGSSVRDAAAAIESLMPVDLQTLVVGRQRYALLTNEQGGIRDDLMIANRDDRLSIVANAACKDADEVYLRSALSRACTIERRDDRALLALQGPAAEAVLAGIASAVAAMRFMDVREVDLLGTACVVSRSGYTGEDGFEISVPATSVEDVARKLMENPQVALIGLGARDSLRLEAGLCLYGSDLDTTTTPVEAALEWSIQASRRSGGSRTGGFPGADVILKQLVQGAQRRRVGLRPEGRAPIRQGTQLFADLQSATPIGSVTSGGFGPSVNVPIAMGYVSASSASVDNPIYAELRGERVPTRIAPLPFTSPKYRR